MSDFDSPEERSMHVLANNQLAYSVDICGREITVIFFSSCFILFILFHLLYLILLTTGRRDNTTPDFLAKCIVSMELASP